MANVPELNPELAHYRAIFDLALLGTAHVELASSRIIWANPSFGTILGYSESEVVGLSLSDLTHPEDLTRTRERLAEIKGGALKTSSVDRRYRHKDGHYVWVNITATVKLDGAGKPTHLIGIIQDISERKRHEQELRDGEERLNAILESVQDVVWSFSATENRLMYMNPTAAMRLYGRSANEFYSDRELWMNVVHPDDRALVQRIWKTLEEQGGSQDDYRILRPDGEIRWVQARAWTTKGPGGNAIRFEGVVRDVTEGKSAELALKESEARLRLVMNLGNIGLWELNPVTNKTEWSPVLKDLLGVHQSFAPSAEAFHDLVHPDDRLQMASDSHDLRFKKRGVFPPFRVKRPDGSIRWLQNVGNVVTEGDKLIGAIVDITDVKMAEGLIEAQKAKMVTASKMSALGEMAGGLAHEINNPVAIIHGNAQLLKQLATSDKLGLDELKRIAEIISQTSERISKITRSLRAFARDAEQDDFELVSLKSVIDETAAFCRERFRLHGIDFTIDAIDPDLKLQCRSVQISQVLLNLLNNAHDAVESLERRWIRISVSDLGDRVEIFVSDSGTGISQEIRDRIFQPFFTTKEVGKGTGLGLSVASGLAESHAGSLSLDPAQELTRFVLNLPKRQTLDS